MCVCVCVCRLPYLPLHDNSAVWLVYEQVINGRHPITSISSHRISDLRLTHLHHCRYQLYHLLVEWGREGREGGREGVRRERERERETDRQRE